MSLPPYCCNLCGIGVQHGRHTRGKPWLSEFKAVIASSEGEVTLTGMGLIVRAMGRSFPFEAPRNANDRWSDVGYNRDLRQQFGVEARSTNGCHGSLFHESCWSMLERAFYPEPVPLDRIYDLCLSMPKLPLQNCINWGHEYEGLYNRNQKPYFPWDVVEDLGVRRVGEVYESESSDSDGSDDAEWIEPNFRALTLNSDPCKSDEIRVIIQEQPQPPPERTVAYSLSDTTSDRFSQLPSELRSEIANYLPTCDFLNGRLVLRGLWDIFDSQAFWATRFLEPGAERSWVFESIQPDDYSRDWRYLYKLTSDAHVAQSAGIQNRMRVWKLAMRLRTILSTRPLALLPHSQLYDSEVANATWIEAQADVSFVSPNRPHDNFVRGCTIQNRQIMQLGSGQTLKSIGLSYVKLAEDYYLSGLRFYFRDGQCLQVGYRSHTTEQTFEFGAEILTGFRLAISPRGMQGLQFNIDGNRSCSRWYGRSNDLPHTNRLVSSAPITTLIFGLDASTFFNEFVVSSLIGSSQACKIVSIRLGRDLDPPETTIAEVTRHQESEKLKQARLWFPSIPPPSAGLNERCFPEALQYTGGYRPLIWCHFGGPNGNYLKHLVAMKFYFHGRLFGIEFKYDNPAVPDSCRSLGRHQCGRPACHGGHWFSIDGPGGELIASVVVVTFQSGQANYSVVDLKIETTRGRSFRLNNEQDLRELVRQPGAGLISRRLDVTGNTIITGLYARQSHRPKSDLTTLGVMNESP